MVGAAKEFGVKQKSKGDFPDYKPATLPGMAAIASFKLTGLSSTQLFKWESPK